MSALRRHAGKLAGERGMTLIELMIAAMIAAIGVAAVTTVLMGSRDLVSDSERGDAATHVAEREMERALAAPYAQLALTQQPGMSTDPGDPRFHVSNVSGTRYYRWDQASGGAAPTRVLVDPTDGALSPSTAWSDGRLSGTVYRFVTVYDDPGAANDPTNPVLPDGEGKRVTVVVTVGGGNRPRKPVLLNSVVLP